MSSFFVLYAGELDKYPFYLQVPHIAAEAIIFSRYDTSLCQNDRNSRLEVFCKKGVFKIFAKFTGKRLCLSVFVISCRPEGLQLYLKETAEQGFSCVVWKMFKNTCFVEHLRTAASEMEA